jgi:hypothetical protein
MTIWLCAERDTNPHDAPGYATEAEAIAAADVLARAGKVAVVWPVEVDE